MNTLENKTKFYGQYYGQNIVRSFLKEQSKYLTDVDADKFKIPHLIINSYLELKPLSSISDEDAIEVCKVNPWSDYHEAEDVQPYIDHVKEFLKYPEQLTLNVVDKIRELGYALPWNGITVEQQIKYGWIKLKRNDTQNSYEKDIKNK